MRRVAATPAESAPTVAAGVHINPDHYLETPKGRAIDDEIADEGGLRNVFAALEPPGLDEGFARVLEVSTPPSGFRAQQPTA